ncbi:MAG: hypothetical protein NTY90_03870 [Candidatus Micrarchaeota archaeon]|nr:hypothetical protein [Candidatus Micrarchaeota archaeon]
MEYKGVWKPLAEGVLKRVLDESLSREAKRLRIEEHLNVRDIAERLGVSRMSAWRALNHSDERPLVVVKFGGKSLSKPDLVMKAAWLVKKAFCTHRVAVVVSAMGDYTNQTISLLKEIAANDREWDHILSFGERSSAAVFSLALQKSGVPCRVFEPPSPEWPVISDDSFGNAEPILEECRWRANGFMKPLLESRVAIVPGFIAATKKGRITTLGRGGSDLTALLLANCLGASEVVKVTDVPAINFNGRRAQRLKAGELRTICSNQEKNYERINSILQERALAYLQPPTILRVISHESSSLNAGGTVVEP